jgi:hypothetical protein
VRVALSVLALSLLAFTNARAEDRIGIVLSASPSGAATRAVTMGVAAEATSGSIPIFLRTNRQETLYGVGLSATPLRDENGVVSVTPAFDRETRTIPSGGALRRVDVTVSGLKALGTFRSTLYATHGSRTQTLGTLTVIHARRSNELQIASIVPARGVQQLPLAATRVTVLMTVKNTSDTDASITAPEIAGLTFNGDGTSQADMPTVRVSDRDGRSVGGPFVVAAGDAITMRLVLDDVKRTGRYSGTLGVSAGGHEPVEQSFGFDVKQGPLLPAVLIALGVAISYAIRRRYSSGRIGRTGQRRLVARLLSDVSDLRLNTGELERREALILDAFERQLVDISDELELARFTKKTDVMSEIDQKIDLFLDVVAARRHVRAMTPESLQARFEPALDQAARFLAEPVSGAGSAARFASLSDVVCEIPASVEAAVRERFRGDVDRFIAAVEASPAVVETLPIRVLDGVDAARQLADAARFVEARAELARAQLAFARVLAEDLLARIPDPDAPPPGSTGGWPRFRAATVDALKAVRRQRRGEHAAEAYRRIWQDYLIELSTRLKSSAARERRAATGARKELLTRVVEASDEAASKAIDFDPASVDAYRVAVEGYLRGTGVKPNSSRLRSALEDAHLPPPLTVVAAGLRDDGERRVTPSGAQSAASLTKQVRKRHWSLALFAAVVAIPAGLAMLWAPNDTWGDLADGATIFAWGLGLQALAAIVDARRLGWAVSRDAASARRAGTELRHGPAALDVSS